MEITLSKWFFDGVMDKRNVLAISPLYFEITSGLGKWLYRASRKHAGGNGAEGFTIGFETLHQKSGSELPSSFKNKILELARANSLPEINLEVIGAETPRPKLKMVMRRYMDGHREVSSEAWRYPFLPVARPIQSIPTRTNRFSRQPSKRQTTSLTRASRMPWCNAPSRTSKSPIRIRAKTRMTQPTRQSRYHATPTWWTGA
jgi:hypothetical protein